MEGRRGKSCAVFVFGESDSRETESRRLRKRESDGVGLASVGQFVLGIFGGRGDREVKIAGDGNGDLGFGESFFVEFALHDFAIMIGDFGGSGGSRRNADADRGVNAVRASGLTGDRIDVGARFIADTGNGGDVNTAGGIFLFCEFGGDNGGTLWTNRDIRIDFGEGEISEEEIGWGVFLRVNGNQNNETAAIHVGGEGGGGIFFGEEFGANGEAVFCEVCAIF